MTWWKTGMFHARMESMKTVGAVNRTVIPPAVSIASFPAIHSLLLSRCGTGRVRP